MIGPEGPTAATVTALGDVLPRPPGAEAVVSASPLAFFASLCANAVPAITPAPPFADAFAWTLPLTATPVA